MHNIDSIGHSLRLCLLSRTRQWLVVNSNVIGKKRLPCKKKGGKPIDGETQIEVQTAFLSSATLFFPR